MRLKTPRVPCPEVSEWSAEQSAALGRDAAELQSNLSGNDKVFNVLKAMANHPALCASWLGFSTHLLFDDSNTLPPPEREMVILRIGWLCDSGYEFGQHILLAQKAGVTKEQIIAVSNGPDDPSWSDHQRTILRAVDELHSDAFISDATYAALETGYDTKQIMDLIFTVGQYNMLSMALNSLGVQLDEGVPDYKEFVKG
ncbi:MAG: carboxymuconolactone decarboxylase family protein [Gammaproteobacteria bacterium]